MPRSAIARRTAAHRRSSSRVEIGLSNRSFMGVPPFAAFGLYRGAISEARAMRGDAGRAPDAAQREAKRNGALLIRGPSPKFWTPGLHRTASRCGAPGERV